MAPMHDRDLHIGLPDVHRANLLVGHAGLPAHIHVLLDLLGRDVGGRAHLTRRLDVLRRQPAQREGRRDG